MSRDCYWLANRLPNRMLSWILVLLVCALSTIIPAAAQFETRSVTPSVFFPLGAAVGDFNHDGKLDLAVSTCNVDNQVSVMLGNGDGTLRQLVNYTVEGCPDAPAVGDFNGDGNLDLVVFRHDGHGKPIIGKWRWHVPAAQELRRRGVLVLHSGRRR